MNSERLCVNTKFLSIILVVLALFLVSVRIEAEEPRFLKPPFPDGFSQKEPVKFYDPGNLYEYINGQAVFYLGYRFKQLEHGFYGIGESTFYIDIYELGSRLSAFGSFRQQREEGAAGLSIGCEGSILDYLTVFYKGNYYIEIIPMSSGTDDQASMKLLAEYVEKNIPGSSEIPPEVMLFPKEELIDGSERYVDENLISYSFMGRGLTARYLSKGEEKEIRIFIAIADNETNAKDIFEEYRTKLQNPSPVNIGSLEGIKGQEPYRGTTILSTWKQYVFGCLGVENETKSVDLLNAVLLNLKK